MELRGATVLLLGGSGLVGLAVARRLLAFGPARLLVAGMTQQEAESGSKELRNESGDVAIEPLWGDIFMPSDLADRTRSELLADGGARRRLVDDLLASPVGSSLESNLLVSWLVKFRPAVVIDCVNTATALAYQDQFAQAASLLRAADEGRAGPEDVEKMVLTLALPQLIRHLQLLAEGLRRAGTQAYVKIGTSGTGGMGFNIPYTHSEERPSRTLMAKSAVAGAHSLFLFLLGRTPGAPAIVEIKPTAAIAWREIAFGAVRRGGREVPLVDCTKPIPLEGAFSSDAAGWSQTGKTLENVYINLGENGVFAREEFETVSALGQMELVTPEEIADAVIHELTGKPTGKDIVAALDGASFGPTYRAGYLRSLAAEGLRALEERHGVRSVAFEMLGPPRLTKLLFEAHILGRLFPTVRALSSGNAKEISRAARDLLLDRDASLRREIISVGIPILMPEGNSLLRGEEVVVQPEPGCGGVEAALRGWVDLRPANFALWVQRATAICAIPPDTRTGSSANWTAVRCDEAIRPSQMAVWVFENEDGGYRIKR